ncbi:MAG: hypothetical protein ACREEM_27705 [Blastocatellia bacterium]
MPTQFPTARVVDGVNLPAGAYFNRVDRERLWDVDWNNFQPRLGLAFLPFGNEKTVIRASGGLFNGRNSGKLGFTAGLGAPFFIQQIERQDQTGRPGILRLGELPAASFTTAGTFQYNVVPLDNPDPFIQSWTLSIQRELPGQLLFEASYLGNRAYHVSSTAQFNVRRVPGAATGLGCPAPCPVARPFPRAYPQFDEERTRGPFGWSNYHGGVLKLERRFANGLAFLGSFTWSKGLDSGTTCNSAPSFSMPSITRTSPSRTARWDNPPTASSRAQARRRATFSWRGSICFDWRGSGGTMKISRRTYLKISTLAGASLCLGERAQADDKFLVLFSAADAPGIQRLEYGKPFTATEPRGPLGVGETNPAFKRGNSFGALTNVEFVTKPFVAPAAPLRLNIDVLHGTAALTCGAYVMVEALDEWGKAIPGFEREKSLAADVNELDHLIAWGSQTSSALAGRTIALRFLLRDARFYALHTQERAKQPVVKLTLAVDDATLEPWQTTPFSLRGEDGNGNPVVLDHKSISLIVSDPDLVVARSDKRDLQKGRATVFRETKAPKEVTLRAELIVGNKEVRSNPVVLKTAPSTKRFKTSDFKLFFMQPSGAVSFAANTLQYYADTRGLPTTPKAMTVFNRQVGDKHYVRGSSRGAGYVFRGVTTDGIDYTVEPVNTTMDPQNFMDMTWSPARQEYLAFERAFGPSRFMTHTSKDGLNFTRAGTAYHDFDGIESVWDAAKNQYVAFQLSFQPLAQPRPHPDNLKYIVALHGNRGRRIFTRRTSPDGVRWTPGHNVDQRDPATWTPPEHYAIVPDADDPPDLECYWLNVFPYGDRYLGFVMFYAVAPPPFLATFPSDAPGNATHGPHVTTEWIVSADLRRWERPFRNRKATEDWRIYFAHAPLMLHDRMLFLTGNQIYNFPPQQAARPGQNNEIYSVPIDRIVSASGSSGASFSTKPFVMPKDALHLNAAGSLAVEVLDASGQVIRGFEKAKNSLSNLDELHHRMQWNGADTTALAGQTVRMRFHLQAARVYSLHTYK